MKTMKKLLVALVAVLILSSACAVAVFANEPTLGDLGEAGQLMGMIDSATNVADKVAAIEAYDAYMASHFFADDPISILNYEIIVENATAAKLKFSDDNIAKIKEHPGYVAMQDSTKVNEAIAHLSSVEGMFNTYYFVKESEAYKAFSLEYATVVAATKEAYNARILENYTASFAEYDYPVAQKFDFEPSATGSVTEMKKGNFANADPTKFEYAYKIAEGEGSQGSAGYYYEKTLSRTGDPYSYVDGLAAGSYPGFVLEFDYYHVAGAKLQLSRGTISSYEGVTFSSTTEWGTFTTASYIPGHSNLVAKGTTVSPDGGVLVEDAWNRIAFAFVKETQTFKVYANYQYLTSFQWTKAGDGNEFDPGAIRIKYTGNELRMDNVVVYYGTQPRVLDRFEQMSLDERFNYYCGVIGDETETFENRDGAYAWMVEQLYNFYDEYNMEYVFGISEETKASVDYLLAFNYDKMKLLAHVKTLYDITADYELRVERYDVLTEFLAEKNYIVTEDVEGVPTRVPNVALIGSDTETVDAVQAYIDADRAAIWNEYLTKNLEELKAIYDELVLLDEMTLDTITDRQTKITAAKNYISTTTADKILQSSTYSEIVLGLDTEQAKVDFDTAVRDVQIALQSFASAPTYDAMKKWSTRVEEKILYEGVSVFSDLTKLKELPDMKTAYESMSDVMLAKTEENNASKIVMGVDFYKKHVLAVLNARISAETPEGEEPTLLTLEDITSQMVLDLIVKELVDFEAGLISEKTSWDYVRTYSLIVARAADEGYKADAEGVDVALAFNEEVYAYYHNLIQIDHIAHLNEMLAKYETATTYVDKLGICVYIENYIEKNAVDTTREDATNIATRIAEIRASLTPNGDEPSDAEKEYQEALIANTALFIAAVDEMIAVKDDGYKALYDAWQEALKYYYYMEINSTEVEAAIAEYAVLERQLMDWQTYSDIFIETVKALDGETPLTKQETYRILAEACAIKSMTNDTYEGMDSALATYNREYNSYMGFVNAVNAEISETATLALAERQPYTVLDAIARLFAKVFGF